MGLYGKYTRNVNAIAVIQIFCGLFMLGLGVAFRLLVCSWITDAAFGFWIGLLVLCGGLSGYRSTKKHRYILVNYYICFNSLSVMFTTVVIFCHSVAWVFFDHQMQSPLYMANNTNSTNITSTNITSITMSSRLPANISHDFTASLTVIPKTLSSKLSTDKITRTPSMSINFTTTASSSFASLSSPSPSATPSSSTTPRSSAIRCYTDQTWSKYENGWRGVRLGLGMIGVCVAVIVVNFLSFGYCWAAASVQPTGVRRKKAVIQGFYSDVMAVRNETENVANNRGDIEMTEMNASDQQAERPTNEQTNSVSFFYSSLPPPCVRARHSGNPP